MSTANLWLPLIEALGLEEGDYLAPSMPGFAAPLPAGFAATKEAYLDWLTATVETAFDASGRVDLVGHDWGAALCLRLAHLRPELIGSWATINGVLEPTYRWHSTARIWQTPVIGELFMAMATPARLVKMLIDAGMPEDMARLEARHVGPDMKRAILKLYRSAKSMAPEWVSDLSGLPRKGLVIWGDKDPFVPIRFARTFCEAQGFPLRAVEGAGHWAVCERPGEMAAHLAAHWGATARDVSAED
jgi:pimeloyl-ACP methyl ester carboxylesterase